MKFRTRISVLASAALIALLHAAVAKAAPANGQQPGGHLKITQAFVDFGSNTIVITGEDFGFGGPLGVTFGDMTPSCNAYLASAPQTIICTFGSNKIPPAGDYLLTVSTGAGQSQSDEFYLTIGAAGPQGEQGIQGVKGDTGDQGIQGIQGIQGDIGIQGVKGIAHLARMAAQTGQLGHLSVGGDPTMGNPAHHRVDLLVAPRALHPLHHLAL